MRRPVTLSIREDLIARADGERGQVSRSRFVEGALEAALADPAGDAVPDVENRESTGSGDDASDGAAPPRAPVFPRKGDVVPPEFEADPWLAVMPASEMRRFRCGCHTTATSPSAVCAKHGRSLAP